MLHSLSADELQFIKAIEDYKSRTGKLFLSWTEVLEVLRDLGYRKPPPARAGAQVAQKQKAGS